MNLTGQSDQQPPAWTVGWRHMPPAMRWATCWAGLWFFFALLSYFVIRPVRETLGTYNPDHLRWLFLGTFLSMLAAVPLYAVIVRRYQRSRIVAIVYHFFSLNLVAFALLGQMGRTPDSMLSLILGWSFFVWVSVFAFFNTSIFWSVMVDVFSGEYAKQFFGLIAACGTVGAILGSLVASQLTFHIGIPGLLWTSVISIQCGVFCSRRMIACDDSVHSDQQQRKPGPTDQDPGIAGGGLFDGITHVARSPYLMVICIFLLFLQYCGTHFYFVQADLVKELVPGEEARTALFGKMNLYSQICTIVLQVIVFRYLLTATGLSVTLMTLPLIYMGAFVGMALAPSITMLIISDMLRRGFAYGIIVPAREVLFTVVDRDDKYKSKSFIDTVVLRGGDMATGQVFSFIKGLQVAAATMNLWMIPVTILWAGVAAFLGVQHKRKTRQSASASS